MEIISIAEEKLNENNVFPLTYEYKFDNNEGDSDSDNTDRVIKWVVSNIAKCSNLKNCIYYCDDVILSDIENTLGIRMQSKIMKTFINSLSLATMHLCPILVVSIMKYNVLLSAIIIIYSTINYYHISS